MSNTKPAERMKHRRAGMLAVALGLGFALSHAASVAQEPQGIPRTQTATPSSSETLSARQRAIVPIASFAAAGNIAKLNATLNEGLDAGLTVSDGKEILVQVYAYAGFPRRSKVTAEEPTGFAPLKTKEASR